MPREKNTQFDIICGLKELSDEADKALPPLLDLGENSAFGIWFAAIKETLIKIRDCETLKDIHNVEYPPCSALDKKNKNAKNETPETLRENIHAAVIPPASSETVENASKKAAACKAYAKHDEIVAKEKKSTAVTPLSSSLDACQVHVVKCDEIAAVYEKKSSENRTVTPSNSSIDACQVRVVKCDEIAAVYEKKSAQNLAATPLVSSVDVLKETAECQARALKRDEIAACSKSKEGHTVMKSSSPVKLNNAVVKLERIDLPKLDVTYNLCTPEMDGKPESQELYRTPVLNLTFNNNIVNKKLVLNSDVSQNSNQKSKKVNNDSGVITRSASKLNTPSKYNSARQGCKRKSSTSADENNKKQKSDTSSAGPTSKTTQPKYPMRRIPSKNALTADSKTKVQAVIVPPVQPKQSVVSKEQQILEEIRKKEEKANQNIKRVLAERQQKTEQNKKNREEKRTKTLQKRMQLEKEKEVRLEKPEVEVKTSQVKTVKDNSKSLAGKTRTKELIDQHMKENKSSGLSGSKQSANIINKTPVKQMIEEDDDCYELTPLPDSSTYNFSDEEEDEKPKGKYIPRWAQGVHLKNALILQFYNPIDTDELFGRVIDTPNLAEIFKVNKKRYDKRTSSAIWNSPPVNKSFKH